MVVMSLLSSSRNVGANGECTGSASLTRPTDHFHRTPEEGQPFGGSDRMSEALPTHYQASNTHDHILTAVRAAVGIITTVDCVTGSKATTPSGSPHDSRHSPAGGTRFGRSAVVIVVIAGAVMAVALIAVLWHASLTPPWASMERVARGVPVPTGFTNQPAHRRSGARCPLSPSCDMPNVEAALTPVTPRDATCHDLQAFAATWRAAGYRPDGNSTAATLCQSGSSGSLGSYPVSFQLHAGNRPHAYISVLIGDPGGWNL
jgi:hypothetical protein